MVRYGKFLLLQLTRKENAGETDHESALLVHLGMTGMLRPQPAGEPHAKHTHVVALLDDGRELRYTDPRRFGRMAYLAGESLQEELRRFGADPLEAGLEEFTAKIRGKRADQGPAAGSAGLVNGNIYADESLWKARCIQSGWERGCGGSGDLEELYRALQGILRRAIVMRGSSIADFLDAEGQPGEYQQRHRAYGREGILLSLQDADQTRDCGGAQQLFSLANAEAPRRGKSRRNGKQKHAARRGKMG